MILEALITGGEMYGLELVEISDGGLKRGTVYVTLNRMEDKGFVTSELGEATPERGGRAKRYFRVTAKGLREVRETQRAFVYFSLHGLTVDQVLVNRVLPDDVEDVFFREWRTSQKKFLKEVEAYFAPVPMRCVPLFRHEVLGLERIRALAQEMFSKDEDPAAVTRTERPYSFRKREGRYEVRLHAPFATKGEVNLFKKGHDLIIEVGTVRRHVGLPNSMAGLSPVRAHLDDGTLVVELQEQS